MLNENETLPVLTSEMRYQLLEWGCPKLPLPETYLNNCIHDLVTIHANNKPHHLAVYHSKRSLTYSELDLYANKLANKLIESGVQAGDKVAVLLERSPLLIIAMLAIFKIGAIYVPINSSYPDERISYILIDSNPKVMLIDNQDFYNQSFIDNIIYIDEDYQQISTYPSSRPESKSSPQNLAYTIYTSGSTGEPKGVLIKHMGLNNLAYWYKVNFKLTDEDRSSQFASQAFDTFFCETIPFLANGNSIYIINDHDKLTPTIMLPWLAEHQITICDLPTAYAQMLFSLSWPPVPHLKIVKVGGESITRYPQQMLTFDIWNSYGPTEATIETTFMKIFYANISPADQPIKYLPPPIGKPMANAKVLIVDNDNQLVPIGTPGELLIGGLGVSSGYVNRSDLTESKFIEDTITENPNGKLYRTGDLAKWLPDGNIEYLGRIDNQVKIRGYRIEIEEIKSKINQLSDVREAVVIAKDTPNGQKSLISYLVPNLDKIRIPYEEPALITLNNYQYKHATTMNFSKAGLGISGLHEQLSQKQEIKIYFKLPNVMNGTWFIGNVVWQKNDRAGILLKLTEEQAKLLNSSVEYFLSNQYLAGTLCNPSYARSLHKALESKLPEYMVPSKFIVLEELPMTQNGKIDIRSLTDVVESESPEIVTYIEPTTETEKSLAEIWHSLLGHKQISINDSFFDIGGNSLLASRLSILIYEKFNITIPTELLFNSPYIVKLADFIDSKGRGSVISEEINELIQHDLILDSNFRPTRKININAFNDPSAILVTGAAGFFGIHIVRSLLKQTKAKIYCLVRKGKHDSASDKLLKTVKQYQLDAEISLSNPRIIIVPGDISLKKFGLSSEVYTKLAEYIDLIYHCAAEVHMLANYKKLRAANVFGTAEIIKFAAYKIDKPIHFISTLSAANIIEDDVLIEAEPDYQIRFIKNGYGMSKWVAENLITQIKKRGLKSFIYRFGNIFGQSNTGITNLNDFLLITLKGCIQLGYAPNWQDKIKILPVDFVSNVLVAMSLSTQNKYDIYHIDQPKGIAWIDLISWLNDYGYKIKLCPVSEWQEYLRSVDQDNALFPFVSYFLAQEPVHEPEVSIQHTQELLNQLHIEIPPIDDSLLTNYFNKLNEIGYLKLNKERVD